ncbi:hypothetical protein Syun_027775 [Stephania yunnanensis]|uniref:Protein kinase domain-containing protein n=1 Tax=Stephania yunnanensis TaxID=152371 RepID=A0AAP0HN45_9MAGN
MALNMKTLTQALAKTAAVIEKTVQTTVQEVTGPKPLQDYDLIEQIGSGGPGLAWKLYSAKSRGSAPAQYPIVCVWVLDKRALSEERLRAGLSKAADDSFFEIVRADAARLLRIRHPGVLHVVQALDENKNAMAMVTEPLFASVANTLGSFENMAKVPKELKGMEMGVLEVKHGLLQVAESLDFLHNNAHLIHRAISPENVFITSSGAWKLGGFGFAISADQSSDDASTQVFHYLEYDVEDSVLPLQPSLNYTAPELVRSKAVKVGYAADIFSLGCLAYHLIARKPLLECHNNVKMYTNSLMYLSNNAFSSLSPELVHDLQRLLSMDESSRPSASDFTGSPFFRNDTRLRALRFLDHMLERDNMQKSEFLKALSDMWKDFDSRVLRYKVLPPLCAELRNVVMQPMILPMVLTIAESQDKNDFELYTLPALVPVFSAAAGETLLLLVKHLELIFVKTGQEQLISYVLPLVVRAYGDNDVRIQEEVLKRTVVIAKQLDVQLLKEAIVPLVHGLALKTTVAAVRVNALLCLGDLVNKLDKPAVLEILQTIQRCTAVDRSAPTLMCTLSVSNSVLKQFGVEFVAEHVLPLLSPLLLVPQLNVQQFAKYMLFVKDILRKIEEKRGVTVIGSGALPVANGVQSEIANKISGSVSSTSSSPAWDEDWGSTTASSITNRRHSEKNLSSMQTVPIMQPATATMPLSSISSDSSKQTGSCAPADLEWPPRISSDVPSQIGDFEKQKQSPVGTSAVGSDDFDPFADWPLQPSNSTGGLSSTSTGTARMSTYGSGSNLGSLSNVNFKSNTNPIGMNNQTQIRSMRNSNISKVNNLNSGVLNPLSSIGFSKQNQGISTFGSINSNASSTLYDEKKTSDIGSIFASSKNDQMAPRLAPPPAMAVGAGRGRGRGNQGANASMRSKPKASSEQPPLLDLL